jgi:ABC-type nitrate/sulfonate/bicarbonate transport system permease component
METDLTLEMALYHLGISLFATLIAIVLGFGLGYLLTLLLRHWVQRSPGFRNVLVIFPWRAISTWIALIFASSGLMIFEFGLGFPADVISIAGILVVFTIPWMVQAKLSAYFPLSGLGKMISFGRTLAILAVAIEVLIHFGLGNFLDNAARTLDTLKINQGFAVIGIMMLGLDLLIGFGQILAARNNAANYS